MIPRLPGGRLTRRSLLAAGTALIPALARGQPQTKPALGVPPTVISQPPRQWGALAPPEIYPDPDVLIVDPSFAPYLVRLASLHRLATGFAWAEGPGLVRRGPLPRVQRRQGRHAVPLSLGDAPRQRVSPAVLQQQWELVRLPGPSALDPGFLPAGGSLGGRRLDDRHRRFLSGQAPELAQRPRAASGRQHLVHRPALWRPVDRGPPGRQRRPGQPERAATIRTSAITASASSAG